MSAFTEGIVRGIEGVSALGAVSSVLLKLIEDEALVAFQITDDILDCSGETVETGKIAGVDLREGTPTLPLLLAAQADGTVRRALAGGPLDGALVRVAATGALERSREIALDYARKARACLNGQLHRDELEALTHLVVDRES